MENFRGNLVKAGQPVIEGIEGRMTIDNNPVRGQMFSGYFTVPGSVPLKVHDVYELVLQDGRSSRIKIDRVNTTSQGAFASFASDL